MPRGNPEALKTWRAAVTSIMGPPVKGEFKKLPKKGTQQYTAIKALFDCMRKK